MLIDQVDFQGQGFDHWVFWANRDDAVFVFGSYCNGLYIEGFRLKDGKNIFRFETILRD